MTNPFDYNDGKEITGDAFRISASQLSKFFDRTSEWYHENFLGAEGFTGSTASVLGTVVHAGIEMYIKTGKYDTDVIEAHLGTIKDKDIDVNHVRNQYVTMIEAALPFVDNNMPEEVEKFVFQEVLPGIGAGGSIDALRKIGNNQYEIIDWKTTSAKSPPTRFSRNYWFQQMCYAWVLKQKGMDVKYVKLVYITKGEVNRISEKTGKPLKDYPSTTSVVTEEITDEKLEMIGSCINLIAESVQLWKDKPELRHILAQDMRLKPKEKPITFDMGK